MARPGLLGRRGAPTQSMARSLIGLRASRGVSKPALGHHQTDDFRACNHVAPPLPLKHGHFPINHGRSPIKHGSFQPGAALHGFRFTTWGNGIQWENTASAVMALVRPKNYQRQCPY